MRLVKLLAFETCLSKVEASLTRYPRGVQSLCLLALLAEAKRRPRGQPAKLLSGRSFCMSVAVSKKTRNKRRLYESG